MTEHISEITNILETMKIPEIVNISEYYQLVEISSILMDDLINNEPNIYTKNSFVEDIVEYITELLEIQFEPLLNDTIHFYIDQAIYDGIQNYHTYISPIRSFKTTFIRRNPNITEMEKKLLYLENIPQPQQGTSEWYIFRHKFLTASSIWKVFGTERLRDQLIYDKCSPINVEKYNYINTESPLHWGHKYEPLSLLWYENEYNTKVSDYGCIPHKNISYIAASPDGINTDKSSLRYGRMVEVKNIVNRDINGIPKSEYWIQMQIQMEVCMLNECDFLETRFVEYENKEEFDNDGEFHCTKDGKLKGIIMYFIKNGKPLYEYAPLNLTETEFEQWELGIMNKYTDLSWIKNIYWRLDEVSCILVLRNKVWFNLIKQQFEDIWNNITHDKQHGYEHRAPNRKEKKKQPSIITVNKCFINTDELLENNIPSSMVKPSSEENLIKIITENYKDSKI
jgi:putative phage-type endonuclease